MAKMSGGMGMPGMFGGMPMGGLPPKKKKPTPSTDKRPPTEKSAEEHEEYASPSQQRIPMFGMPGMAPPKNPDEDINKGPDRRVTRPTPQVTTLDFPAEEVPDVEDVVPQPIQRTPTGERAPAIPSESKYLIPRKPVMKIARQVSHDLRCPYSETISKTYVTSDGVSEYVMTVCVSRMW